MGEVHTQIRQLREHDFPKYLQLIHQLSPLAAIRISDNDFARLTKHKEVWLYILEGRIVGTASLYIEEKCNRPYGVALHIEDVVVDAGYRGMGIGRALVDFIKQRARDLKAYKVLLDCSPNLVSFYEKCGFKNSGVCMRVDL